MGISKKGKRKIIVDECEYYWSVAHDDDVYDLGTNLSLTVIEDNKEFLVRYPVNQYRNGDGENLIIVIGKKFGGQGKWGGTWKRVVSPSWEIDGRIQPASVEALIRWAISDKKVQLVDHHGTLL